MIDELKQELHYWKSYLSNSRYIAGDEYTLADVGTGTAAEHAARLAAVRPMHVAVLVCA
jgi:glutathione S-transferase